MKETRLNGYVYDFSIDCFIIDVDAIQDIYRYLVNKNNKKIMCRLIEKMFIGLLASIVNASNHTKCISLNN